MTTLEGLNQLMKGMGNLGDVLKKLKNKKEAHKILLDIGYSPEEAKYYAQHLSPHDILNLKVKSDLQKGKEAEKAELTEAERKALEKYNIPGLEEADPAARKSIVKAFEERGSLGKGFSAFKESFGAEPWKPWTVNYTNEGEPAGIVIGGKTFNAKQLGPKFMQGNLLPKGGVKKEVVTPYGEETVTEKPIKTAQGTGEEFSEEQVRTPMGSKLSEAGKLIGPGIVGLGAQTLGYPADILSGVVGAAQSMGPAFTPEQLESRRNYFLQEAERKPQDRAFYESLAAQAPPEPAQLIGETLQKYLPTTENLEKLAAFGGEKIGIKPYVSPETPAAEEAQKLGEKAALLLRPETLVGGSAKAIPRIAEAGIAALGAKAAGEIIKEYTDSGIAAPIAEALLGTTYALFPGTISGIYKKDYNKFDELVMNPAKEQGLTVNMDPYKERFNKIYRDINKLRPETDTAKLLQNQSESLKNFINGKNITPEVLQDSYRIMGGKIPDADTALGKKYLQEMIDLQKDALKDFANKLSPGSAKLLENADSFYHAGQKVVSDVKNLKNVTNVRNAGVGVPIFLVSGYKGLIKGAAAVLTGQYIKRLVEVPGIKKIFGDLLKASGAKQILNVQKLTKELDNRVEKEISTWPPAEQQKIRAFSNDLKQKELQAEPQKKR